MEHRVKVTQILRVTKTTLIAVEAETLEEAIEAVSSGEVDLPSASDDKVWVVQSTSLENEEYRLG